MEGKWGGGGCTDLGCRIVFSLGLWWDYGPPLVRIDQIARIVTDDTGRAGIDQRLNSRLLAGLNDASGPLHVDLLVQGIVGLTTNGSRRRRVDNDVRLDLLEDGQDRGEVGNIAIEVRHLVGVGVAVARRVEVEDGELRGVGGDNQPYDAGAQKAAAANDEHAAQRLLGLCWNGSHCVCDFGSGVGSVRLEVGGGRLDGIWGSKNKCLLKVNVSEVAPGPWVGGLQADK